MNPSRILVIQTAFIGDVILSTALLEAIHRSQPQTQIDILVRKGNEGLFERHPYVKQVLVWDKKAGKYASLLKLGRQIRQTRYDLLLNLQRYATTGILTLLSGAKRKVGFDKNPMSFGFDRKVPHQFEEGVHEVDRNYALIADDSTIQPIRRPRLYPSKEDQAFVTVYKQEPYICIAPASVWFTKQFPAQGWIDLLAAIVPTYKVYITGGKGDSTIAESIQQALSVEKRPYVENLCGKLTLLQSAALMQDAVMNYVNDSAPMHLCSSVNAPVSAIYCSTVPSFGYGPLATQSFCIETPQPLACRPCGLHGHKQCPEGHFKCGNTIQTKQLLATLPSLDGVGQ